VHGGELDHALGRLAGGRALLGALQAMVDRVADHVRQRIGQTLDHRLVHLGGLALGDQADRLAGHGGHFADQARHTLEDGLHRLGADRHHAVLDLAGELLQLVETHGDGRGAGEAGLHHALRQHGRPYYRAYYGDVAEAVAEGPRRVVFRFKTNENRELPLILGQLPVLPKHWWEGRDFARPILDPPLGSGPYRIERFETGRRYPEKEVNAIISRHHPDFATLRRELIGARLMRRESGIYWR